MDCWGGDVGLVPEILNGYLNAAVKTNKKSLGSFSSGALGTQASCMVVFYPGATYLTQGLCHTHTCVSTLNS